jgi:hypothetical protein
MGKELIHGIDGRQAFRWIRRLVGGAGARHSPRELRPHGCGGGECRCAA